MRCRRAVEIAVCFGVVLAGRVVSAQDKPPAPAPALPAEQLAAIDRISGNSLKGHLSFLASDLLEGRDTPSKGLDLAAEYIAAQFRRAGLEPVGDDGYFQTANWEYAEPNRESFALRINFGDRASLPIGPDDVSLVGPRTFRIEDAKLIKVDFKTWETLRPEDVEGKAVVVGLPDLRKVERAETMAIRGSINRFRAKMAELKAAAVVAVLGDVEPAGLGGGQLVDPAHPNAVRSGGFDSSGVPTIGVHDPMLIKFFDNNPTGPLPGQLSATLGEPTKRPVKLRNVAGLLRGSDPALKDTVVMVTAHYDHVGVRGKAGTDRIYNGANDDGSGTVSVIELASVLGTLRERPRRSLLFVTFFGEEKGLLGSRYYGRNPLVPVDKTIADVNLEQVGRTDSSEGPQIGTASLTGFGFSEVSTVFENAGAAEGIKVYKHPRNSDAYFGASDNQALADLGVPAHTLCVAYQYPDYHGPADHWDKVDYDNMARIDRLVARALLTLSDSPEEPRWDESNPKAAKYLKAWKDRRKK